MFKNFGFVDTNEIQKTALEALQRQEKQYTRKEKNVQLVEERESRIDHGAVMFEDYSLENWGVKIKKDSNIYNTIISKVEESSVEKIQVILGDFLDSVHSIYEHVNINPDSFNRDRFKLDSSEADLATESVQVIESFIRKNYYDLSQKEKDRTYEERSISMVKEIVENEDIEVNEAMEHAHKAIVVEKLLEDINFPKPVYYRVQELMSSPIYGEIFEQEGLIEKWNNFKNKSNTLSRVFAALI
jgi:hypothetical protein